MSDTIPVKTRKRLKGGGRLKGSGRYTEPTKVARVPESVAANVEFYHCLPDTLEDLAILWETRFEGTVRSGAAKTCASDLRQLISMFQRSTL